MLSIVKSDLFRLSKGSTIRNILIASILVIVLTALSAAGIGPFRFSIGTAGLQSNAPVSGVEFAGQMRNDILFPFFILAIAVAIMGAEYSAGSFRNTLAFNTKRGSVFTAKYLSGLLCCLGYSIISLLVSVLLGSFLFGLGGFSSMWFLRLLGQIFLSIPFYIGMIGVGFCLLVFTQKTSVTNVVYIVGLLFASSLTHQLYQLIPAADWLPYCDPLSAFSIVAVYWEYPPQLVAAILLTWSVFDAAVIALGMYRFSTSDIA